MTDHAVFQVFAYREPDLEPTLDAAARLDAPSGWTVDREVWVTLDQANNETWRIANNHPDYEAREAPPGKLAARNTAHHDAFGDDATAVVTYDADLRPGTPRLLEYLLEPLVEDMNVAAVNSNPKPRGLGPLSFATWLGSRLEDALRPHMHGQCSSFHRGAWISAGPFRTEGIDHTDSRAVRAEEEYGFYNRIAASKAIVEYDPRAVVLESPRRTLYLLNKAARSMSQGRYPLDEWEEERGTSTFRPDRE